MVVPFFANRLKKPLRAVGFGVAPSEDVKDERVPLVTAGGGAASGGDPDGSLRLRIDGVPEFRIGSAWKALAIVGTAIDFASAVTMLALSATTGTFTGIVTTTDGVASGTARRVGGVAARAVAASDPITGATETATAFSTGSYTIPANTLKAGTVVRVRAQGIYTATTGSETHDLALKLGSTAILSLTSIDPANDGMFYIDALIQIRTAGAGGTMVATGTELATGATTAGTAKPWFLAETAVNTTGNLDLAVVVDRQSTATDSDSMRLDVFVVEVIG